MRCERRVAIQDEMGVLFQEAIDTIDQVAGNLRHPFAVRIVRDACDFDTPCFEVDFFVEDPNGNSIAYEDDFIVHSDGRSININRDQDGRITTITDPMGNAVQYQYNDNGDLVVTQHSVLRMVVADDIELPAVGPNRRRGEVGIAAGGHSWAR